jgi:hypothetical protein
LLIVAGVAGVIGCGAAGAPAGPSGLGNGGAAGAQIGIGGTGGGGPVASAGKDGGAATDAGAGAATASGLPCDVRALLALRCTSCHGAPPQAGVPMSLVSYADLVAPSKANPAATNAQRALTRMQSPIAPMPPDPGSPATSTEVAALGSWIAAGYPLVLGGCGGAGAGAVAADAGAADSGPRPSDGPPPTTTTPPPPDPAFAAPPTCTSKRTWSGGNSILMNPGKPCLTCHDGGVAHAFGIGGTVYPTAHEPDLCYGADGANGAMVVITDADGNEIPLYPTSTGNIVYGSPVKAPYRAKVVFMGRERAMAEAQTSGDCNGCHTQNGAMNAPGRILLP